MDYLQKRQLIHFPCTGKKPALAKWQLLEAPKKIPKGMNVGLQCGKRNNLTVIDIDTGNEGLAYWELITDQMGSEADLETPTVKTGRGGFHYYFEYDPSIKTGSQCVTILSEDGHSKKIGIDVRSEGGYVIAPPSRHPDTQKKYKFVPKRTFDDFKPKAIPSWICDILQNPLQESVDECGDKMLEVVDRAELVTENDIELGHTVNPTTDKFDKDIFKQLLFSLSPDRADNYDDWMKISFATGNIARKYNEDLLEMLLEWAEQSDKYDEVKTERLYNTGNGKLQQGTIWYFLKQDNLDKFNELVGNHYNKYPQEWFYIDFIELRKEPDLSIEKVRQYISSAFISILNGGHPVVFSRNLEDNVVKWKCCDKYLWEKHNFVIAEKANGKLLKMAELFHEMSCSGDIPTYPAITFEPWLIKPEVKPKQNFNIFKPYPFEYIVDYTSEQHSKDLQLTERIRTHMLVELCDNDDKVYDYYFKYLADMLQNPTRKPGTGIIFITKEGKGKDIINSELMGAVVGKYNSTQLLNLKQLTKDFNKNLEGKILVVLGELGGSDNFHECNEAFKSFLTGTVLRIEPKGVDPYEVPNYARLIAHSNNTDPVSLSQYDRRLLIIGSMGEPKKMDYFKPLHDDVTNPVVQQAFFNLLTHEPLADYNTITIPETSTKKQLQDLHLSSAARFLIEFAQNMPLEQRIHKDDLYSKYEEFCRGNGARMQFKMTKPKFYHNVQALLPTEEKTKFRVHGSTPKAGFRLKRDKLVAAIQKELKYEVKLNNDEDDVEDEMIANHKAEASQQPVEQLSSDVGTRTGGAGARPQVAPRLGIETPVKESLDSTLFSDDEE